VKIAKTADFAADQINLKDYGERFLIQGKPIVKLGVNFDAELHAQHHRLEDTGRWPRFC